MCILLHVYSVTVKKLCMFGIFRHLVKHFWNFGGNDSSIEERIISVTSQKEATSMFNKLWIDILKSLGYNTMVSVCYRIWNWNLVGRKFT